MIKPGDRKTASHLVGLSAAVESSAAAATSQPAQAPGDDSALHEPNVHARPNPLVPRGAALQASLQASLTSQVRRKVIDKGTAYPSKAGFPGVYLNSKVSVFPSRKRPPRFLQPVLCRHLATLFAQHAGKKSELLGSFSTEPGIRDRFDGKLRELDIAYYRSIRDAPQGCKHVVSSEHLGQYLAALASVLCQSQFGPQPIREANCLLITIDHAMALHLRHKSKAGMDYIAVTFYDPNDTAHYKRVEQPTPEGLSSLQLQDLMVSPELMASYAGNADVPLSMMAVSLDHRVQPLFDRATITASVDNMHVALTHGATDDFAVMVEAARHQRKTVSLFELLQAKPPLENAFPGLYRAFQREHARCVSAFTAAVLASDELDREAKVQLLGATSDDGTSGLYLALDQGDAQTIQVFSQAVLNTTVLTEDDRVQLLSAKDGYGHPGLFAAVRAGHADAVSVFAHTVFASNLSTDSKEFLWRADTDFGDAGLYVALQEGHVAVIQALVKSVLDAPALGPEERVRLLESKVLGVPCLFPCFQYGYDQSVEVFAECVLASCVLDDAAKVSLMQAVNDDGLPGLHAAFRGGRTDTVKTFVRSVLRSGLSVADQFTLLEACDHEGQAGLSAAHEEGHVAAADAFCDLVNASQLPAQLKLRLTQA